MTATKIERISVVVPENPFMPAELKGTFSNAGPGEELVVQVEAEARGVTLLEAE